MFFPKGDGFSVKQLSPSTVFSSLHKSSFLPFIFYIEVEHISYKLESTLECLHLNDLSPQTSLLS